MEELSNIKEISEIKTQEVENYKQIKPEGNILIADARNFWDHLFDKFEKCEGDNPEDDIEQFLDEYFKDLKEKSECPDTIEDKPFDVYDLRKRTPEENAQMREDFSEMKGQLKGEWEERYGREWPKYDDDVFSSNGKLIRKAGSDYDAHHIHPLCMGGENVSSNITPLSAEVHYDKQGVHSPDSPYSKLDQMLGG